MYNKCTLIGRLARDPESREFANGGKICKLRILTSRAWKDRATGEFREKTEGHNIVIHTPGLAERIAQSLAKGDLVLVEGPIETRSYKAQDGTTRYITELNVRTGAGVVRKMGSPGSSAQTGSTSAAVASEPPAFAEMDIDDWLSDGDVGGSSDDGFSDFGDLTSIAAMTQSSANGDGEDLDNELPF